ncbi:putative integral membrane protein [Pseudooceanicola batsensis HTCC2597]|uniref:Putative integral membrane protein n=1 Tax=Pseudooceanicola batsensis (strain ATCC BAA-863 / DSM 15984 / KCTC 12145 / HTCC2597) TaxID=252305 RepID=A3U236_PSEBH|nr:extracellular solute-binding protein [Pseudooceanicola batsensis]EAQ01636.1 putative integral membrane protein [Pseudooceanicola batsensis HTCC2597]
MSWRGLTWDHPRGYNALAAADGPVHWEVQPLEGFESAPIAELCAEYDLVVLDHPHLGEALARDCLAPLDEVFAAADLDRIARAAIGPAYASYAMAGRQWALPLDAATQVMALRPDLAGPPPATWEDVDRLSQRGGVALSLAGPHAALSFLSVCAALDPALDLRDGGWPEDDTARRAYEILAPLAARTPASTKTLNPIGLLDLMGRTDELCLIPLVYGYVNYTRAPRPVAFHDAPRAGGRPGSILGGTGICISRRARVDDALRAHLMWLMADETQRGFIPDHDGQPGLRSAWADPAVNAAWGNFYADTAATLEAAAIRPRHDGYIAFQTRASAYLREAFEARTPAPDAIRGLRAMFEASQPERTTA